MLCIDAEIISAGISALYLQQSKWRLPLINPDVALYMIELFVPAFNFFLLH